MAGGRGMLMKIQFDDPLFEAWTLRPILTIAEGGRDRRDRGHERGMNSRVASVSVDSAGNNRQQRLQKPWQPATPSGHWACKRKMPGDPTQTPARQSWTVSQQLPPAPRQIAVIACIAGQHLRPPSQEPTN